MCIAKFSIYVQLFFIYHSSEVAFGEHVVGEDPDCQYDKCFPKVIKRNVSKIIYHKDYSGGPNHRNDIALIRLESEVPLFDENPTLSGARPVCLPWSKDSTARDLEDGVSVIRECVSKGAAAAQTYRSLGHHLMHL